MFPADASFEGATFAADASFRGAQFLGTTTFNGATFSGDTWFVDATFSGEVQFDQTTFSGWVTFDQATARIDLLRSLDRDFVGMHPGVAPLSHQTAYDRAVNDAQRYFLDQTALMLKSLSFLLPYSWKQRTDRD